MEIRHSRLENTGELILYGGAIPAATLTMVEILAIVLNYTKEVLALDKINYIIPIGFGIAALGSCMMHYGRKKRLHELEQIPIK